MNLIKQIAEHLEFLGIGVVDENVYWGTMPNEPDDCICVFSSDSAYGGSEEGARIQILVRGKSTRYAYELSQRIADELIGFDGFLAGDGAHATIDAMNTSAGLGADDLQRELYSSNFLIRYCDF